MEVYSRSYMEALRDDQKSFLESVQYALEARGGVLTTIAEFDHFVDSIDVAGRLLHARGAAIEATTLAGKALNAGREKARRLSFAEE